MRKLALSVSLGKVSGGFVAALYTAFGVTDLWLSLAAFRLGVSEGNPFLAFMGQHGLFVPAKLVLTAITAALIGFLYRRARAQLICWGALLVMVMVDVYHVVSLSARL